MNPRLSVDELNGYPGPRHVLDLARELNLSDETRKQTDALFAEMETMASEIGTRIVAREHDLQRLFADRIIDSATLENLTAEIGGLRGRLRAVHLGYHLRMVDLLTPEQIAAYNRLRGYGQADEHGHGGPDHHHRH